MNANNYPVTFAKGLILDDFGLKRVAEHGGCIDIMKIGYAYLVTGGRGRRKRTLLHRYLMDAPKGVSVDHINRNKLDNRMENLRLATVTENNRNTGFRSHNTSGVRGVIWNKQKSQWQARITVDKYQSHLGFFDDIDEAASMRYAAETQLFGEFAP